MNTKDSGEGRRCALSGGRSEQPLTVAHPELRGHHGSSPCYIPAVHFWSQTPCRWHQSPLSNKTFGSKYFRTMEISLFLSRFSSRRIVRTYELALQGPPDSSPSHANPENLLLAVMLVFCSVLPCYKRSVFWIFASLMGKNLYLSVHLALEQHSGSGCWLSMYHFCLPPELNYNGLLLTGCLIDNINSWVTRICVCYVYYIQSSYNK